MANIVCGQVRIHVMSADREGLSNTSAHGGQDTRSGILRGRPRPTQSAPTDTGLPSPGPSAQRTAFVTGSFLL